MYAVRRTQKRTLLCSEQDFWNMMLSTMYQVPKGEFRLEIKSQNFDPSMVTSGKAKTHTPLIFVALMNEVRICDPFASKQEKR